MRYLVDYQARLHSAGLVVPGWPVRFGGRGRSVREATAVSVALGAGGAPELINFVATDVIAPGLIAFAEDRLLRTWLPRMASAEEIWCQLFSEPDAGSDLTSLRTKAISDGDNWIVTGQKVWSTWAQFARFGLLLARTGRPDDKHRGISAFVVDMATPGIDVRPLRTMTGASEFAEVHFHDVELRCESLVGGVNQGWAVAQTILNAERGTYAARRAAVIEAAFRRTLDTVKGATSPHDRQSISRTLTAIRLLQWQVSKVGEFCEQGHEIGTEAAKTKLLMTRAEQQTFDLAFRLLAKGPAAFDHDEPFADEYLYSRAASIYGGTTEIQLNILGERALGLPRI
jgi:alkylation response protein AidB-like acyl-CoA dehydrogenase